MNNFLRVAILIIPYSLAYKADFNLKLTSFICIIGFLTYLFLKIRHDFAILPLFLITKIQGRNFKNSKDMKEIKNILKLSDKGNVIEELLATPAWSPILSVESTNGKIWETLKKNLMQFIEYIPSKEKLGEIAENEKKYLIENKIKLDSKLISQSTLKIFLKWLFCENHINNFKNSSNDRIISSNNIHDSLSMISADSNEEKIDSDQTSDTDHTNKNYNFQHKTGKFDEFKFINQFITEEYLDKMFLSSLEYRKEIALKGKGDSSLKLFAVESIVDILKKSKYKNLFEWEKPECYSILMQPFIISPMINMSDIAVLLEKNSTEFTDDKMNNFFNYLDFCLYNDHPFPILERYEAETNTQYFIDLRYLKNFIKEKEGNILNFGYGVRSCLGRFYAKEFIKRFFEDFIKEKDLFKPLEGHLYSGRNNDNESFKESIYQIKIIFKVLKNEIIKRIKL